MISLKGLNVNYRNFALRDIGLDIATADYFMLVGPTGSGKTMLLETIAGLHSLKSGEIRLDGRDITNLPPEKRGISIVYQDCALFPHLSVAENILFGLKIRKIPGDNKKKLREMAALVGVEALLKRKPVNLSGGEKQKVALARSLIVKPGVLLLDEPLSALDPETRSGLQAELKRLHKELGITIMHVTHDFEETLSMGKHAAVIGAGRIQQAGTPEQIFRHPESEFVARFTMMRNILPGKIMEKGVFKTGDIALSTGAAGGNTAYACIRPDDVILSTAPLPDSPNAFTGIVTRIEDKGPVFYVTVDIPPEVCCMVTRRAFSDMGLETGKRVSVSMRSEAIHLF